MRYEIVKVNFDTQPTVLPQGYEPFATTPSGILCRRRVRWWERLKTTSTVNG